MEAMTTNIQKVGRFPIRLGWLGPNPGGTVVNLRWSGRLQWDLKRFICFGFHLPFVKRILRKSKSC